MRAVQYDRYGGGAQRLKHAEVPAPSPSKGEVLIRMEATSINQVDWKFQKGVARPVMPRKFPFISGFDLAGEVVEVGAGGGGGLAEYAVASASLTALRPPEVSAAQGACLPVAAVTALRALQTAGVSLDPDAARGGDGTGRRMNVLVTGASGGVGHFAVQLARLGGHNVTATCGARNLGLVKELGADEALDYGTPEGAALRSPSGRRYDAVVHCAAAAVPWSVFRPALAAAGMVVDITPGLVAGATAILQKLTFSKKRLVPLLVTPRKDEMELLVGMVKQGRFTAVINSRYPLSRAQEGWAKSMSGHATGKVVVETGGPE
ncbi:hypothetical protein C2845_PM04G20520 [Panicum miliaceum]|uniref:Enoyl reductase (ER) domain-containing protein n=1 Tax=Panicum miliaceum TaxID=4540 RepID=A0A3L6QUT5_PANMI|nr:hypothetical protein C2845_PM04G20520 [Panicum miliaceum]